MSVCVYIETVVISSVQRREIIILTKCADVVDITAAVTEEEAVLIAVAVFR